MTILKAKLSEFITASEHEPVVITRNGKPVAALINMADEADLERLLVENSQVFQRIVQRAQEQFERGEVLEPDELWRKLEGSA